MSTIRSERRVVRPYSGLGDVDKCLDGTHLMLNGDVVEGTSLIRESSELVEDQISLRLGVDTDLIAAAVERMKIPEVDVGFAILATGKSLKATEVLFSSPILTAAVPDTIPLSVADYPLVFGDLRGFNVRVCIVLRHDLQPRPLTPHQAGTWLAARDFSVSARSDVLSGFNPQRLTSEIRESLNLPEGTQTYLAVTVDSVLESPSLAEAVAFYIDAPLFDLMHANQSSAISQSLQVDFVIEFLLGVVGEVASEIDELDLAGNEDSVFDKNSELGSLVMEMSSNLDLSPSGLFQLMRKDRSRVRSGLQAALDAGKYSRKALSQVGE